MSQAGRALHLVTKDQFLDSPEWFGVTTDEIFQVSTRGTRHAVRHALCR